MLKDLYYHTNLTLAEAKISRQKKYCGFIPRERKCCTNADIHKPNINIIIMEKQLQIDTEQPLIKTQVTH